MIKFAWNYVIIKLVPGHVRLTASGALSQSLIMLSSIAQDSGIDSGM